MVLAARKLKHPVNACVNADLNPLLSRRRDLQIWRRPQSPSYAPALLRSTQFPKARCNTG